MFDALSIRNKLVVLMGLGSALALLISSVIVLSTTWASETRAALQVLHQLASITSDNMRAALAFHDPASARKLLEPLRANPHIQHALVRDEAGAVLGEYQAPLLSPEQAQRQRAHMQQLAQAWGSPQAQEVGPLETMDGDHMLVIHPIALEGRAIGTLAIVSDTEAMGDKMRAFVLTQCVVSALTLVLMVLGSLRLQALFTRPIYDLIDAMQRVAQTRDYRQGVSVQRQDEFHALYAGFNAMLREVRERDERLHQLATTDALTGLANRRQAMEHLNLVLARAGRQREAVGVIMIDIDFFKRVNDQYGHPAGDAVLRAVATRVQACARDYELVARLGGEEFLVVCDRSDLDHTVAAAERIRRAIAAQPIELAGQGALSVSASMGVCAGVPGVAGARSGGEADSVPLAQAEGACGGPDALLAEHLIARADAALYRAKQGGRNRVESEAWL